MAGIEVTQAFSSFVDQDGKAMTGGYIYIGKPNTNPETNAIPVFWDEGLTIPAAQPIRTIGGYPSRNGSPGRIFTGQAYSINLRTSDKTLVYTANRIDPNNSDGYATVAAMLADDIGYTSPATIIRVAGDRIFADQYWYEVAPSSTPIVNGYPLLAAGGAKLFVLPGEDGFRPADAFGAIGDGATNDAAALNKAGSVGPYSLRAGAIYLASSLVTTAYSVRGNGASIAGQVEVTASNVTIDRVNVVSPLAVYGVFLKGLSAGRISNVRMQDCSILFSGGTPSARLGILAQYIDNLVIDGCKIDYGVNLIRCFDYLFTNNTLDGKYENHNELLHATVRSYGIVSGNTFLNSLDNWIDLYSSGERTVLTGNRFVGCYARLGAGIEIKVSLSDDPGNTSGGINDYGFTEKIIIADNYFGGYAPNITAQSAIISIYYIDNRAAPSFAWADVPKAIAITGNVFDETDTTLAGGASVNGIFCDAVDGVVIANNIFRRFSTGGTASVSSSCVWIEGCNRVSVHDNIMSIRDGSGISIHEACDGLSIQGNQIVEDQGNSTIPAYGIQMTKIGSRAAVALANSIISGNRLAASIASIRCLNTSGSVTDTLISGNVCDNETVLEASVRCTISNNIFAVKSTRFKALGLGASGVSVSRHNVVTGNTVKSPSGSPKNGIEITRMRSSTIIGNMIHTASNGIQVVGSNTAGELDNLIIKDNQSVSQTGGSFPLYSSMNASDTATLAADTNRMIT